MPSPHLESGILPSANSPLTPASPEHIPVIRRIQVNKTFYEVLDVLFSSTGCLSRSDNTPGSFLGRSWSGLGCGVQQSKSEVNPTTGWRDIQRTRWSGLRGSGDETPEGTERESKVKGGAVRNGGVEQSWSEHGRGTSERCGDVSGGSEERGNMSEEGGEAREHVGRGRRRGTVCYLACYNGEYYVIKDYWVEELEQRTDLHEVNMMKLVQDIDRVPKLQHYWVIKVKPGIINKTE
ncbi:hypothetical protein BKA82DRAFT_4020160 [Pisolithus tinctorius]|nr:hypothetical protein BKA82DRAFT_4020160 [Pisolithus tinctorius]